MKLLENVRVLDLGSFITGPCAAGLLADLGADVIKVEAPGAGDPFRQFGGGFYSPQFRAYNRNKRSVTIDLSSEAGLLSFDRLVKTADVVVINNRPGVAEKRKLGYDRLKVINERLIYCSITGFGSTGPYANRPAFDNVGQALSGLGSRFRRGDDPRVTGPALSDPITGHYAALGIVGALYERTRSNIGSLVEVNMLESTMALSVEPISQYLETRKPVPVFQRAAFSQSFNLTCMDGRRVGLHLSSADKFWKNLCGSIGKEEWIEEFPDRTDRISAYEEIAERLNSVFRNKSSEEWMVILARADVPCAPEHELQDLESDPQIAHLETFYQMTHPTEGRVTLTHRPIRINGSREINFRPPPVLGEHNAELLDQP